MTSRKGTRLYLRWLQCKLLMRTDIWRNIKHWLHFRIEKNSETKFNTMKNLKRTKPFSTAIELDTSAINQHQNLCDDEKLELKSSQSREKLPGIVQRNEKFIYNDSKNSSNFCTLPRRPKTNSHCSFHTVVFEKGPGKKSLGFTIVGGADSPRGALGIFIKSIMPNGQAIESQQLRAGDEILAVNGQVCHDLTHQSAVKLFKGIRCGEIVLNICRRSSNSNNPLWWNKI